MRSCFAIFFFSGEKKMFFIFYPQSAATRFVVSALRQHPFERSSGKKFNRPTATGPETSRDGDEEEGEGSASIRIQVLFIDASRSGDTRFKRSLWRVPREARIISCSINRRSPTRPAQLFNVLFIFSRAGLPTQQFAQFELS